MLYSLHTQKMEWNAKPDFSFRKMYLAANCCEHEMDFMLNSQIRVLFEENLLFLALSLRFIQVILSHAFSGIRLLHANLFIASKCGVKVSLFAEHNFWS